jgi:hypothetical protein
MNRIPWNGFSEIVPIDGSMFSVPWKVSEVPAFHRPENGGVMRTFNDSQLQVN